MDRSFSADEEGGSTDEITKNTTPNTKRTFRSAGITAGTSVKHRKLALYASQQSTSARARSSQQMSQSMMRNDSNMEKDDANGSDGGDSDSDSEYDVELAFYASQQSTSARARSSQQMSQSMMRNDSNMEKTRRQDAIFTQLSVTDEQLERGNDEMDSDDTGGSLWRQSTGFSRILRSQPIRIRVDRGGRSDSDFEPSSSESEDEEDDSRSEIENEDDEGSSVEATQAHTQADAEQEVVNNWNPQASDGPVVSIGPCYDCSQVERAAPNTPHNCFTEDVGFMNAIMAIGDDNEKEMNELMQTNYGKARLEIRLGLYQAEQAGYALPESFSLLTGRQKRAMAFYKSFKILYGIGRTEVRRKIPLCIKSVLRREFPDSELDLLVLEQIDPNEDAGEDDDENDLVNAWNFCLA